MPDPIPDIERWLDAAAALPNSDFNPGVPLAVYYAEAIDAANFFRKYWKPQKLGEKQLPGLESAVKRGGLLSVDTGDEIFSIDLAAHELHKRYTTTFGLTPPSPVERGRFLLRELRTSLEYLLDDGVRDERDVHLAKVVADHADDPATQDALALALDDFARLAEDHHDALEGLGGFSSASIGEAIALASELRHRPQVPAAMSDESRAALDLRNRFLLLLGERVAAVREAARFVFRHHPEIAMQATSSYVRKQRAALRAAKLAEAEAPSVE